MLMNTPLAFNILVWVLGALLGIFLLLSIIVVVLVLRLVAALRQVVAKGEQLVDSAEAIGEALKKNAGAVGVLQLLWKAARTANKYNKKG
jgi:hypothetical protein